jgi:hypothetical protein
MHRRRRPEDRGTGIGLFESASHIGGAIAVATYLTVLGADLAYPLVQLGGAAVVGAAASVHAPDPPRRCGAIIDGREELLRT